MKVKAFKHPSTFITSGKSSYKNLVIGIFLFTIWQIEDFFWVQFFLLTSKCHFLGFKKAKT